MCHLVDILPPPTPMWPDLPSQLFGDQAICHSRSVSRKLECLDDLQEHVLAWTDISIVHKVSYVPYNSLITKKGKVISVEFVYQDCVAWNPIRLKPCLITVTPSVIFSANT